MAELHYPPGDETLLPLRDQVYNWLFSERHLKSMRKIKDRVRIHASMEGNAIFYLLNLGLDDKRTEELVQLLFPII